MECKSIDFLAMASQLFQKTISSFPGALPVSISHDLLTTVAFGFVFSLKADGERMFLVFGKGVCYMIGRDLKTTFIGSIDNKDKEDDSTWYLFDAELVEDKNLILIFDTLVFRSQSVIRLEIAHRVEMAKHYLHRLNVIQVHDSDDYLKMSLPSNYSFVTAEIGSCRLQVKPLFTLNHLSDVWNNRDQRLAHNAFPVDGIIFTRRCCQYAPFREDDMSILKWKPRITLDFFVLPFVNDVMLSRNHCVMTEGNVMLCSTENCFSLAQFEDDDVVLFTNQIVECWWENMQWLPVKIRTDKKSPNSHDTILKTLDAIQYPVLFEDFIHA